MKVQAPALESWKPVAQLALTFACMKFAIEFIGNIVAQHLGYGIFRDEMYYIVCGRHLAWGYVDQAPMVALQGRVAEILFGFHHLALLRGFSALAGAAKVFLTGILAWQLGGRRIAQVMAMIAVLIAPVYLGIDSFLSMNSFEPVFWMGCMVIVLLMVAGSSPRCAGVSFIKSYGAYFSRFGSVNTSNDGFELMTNRFPDSSGINIPVSDASKV